MTSPRFLLTSIAVLGCGSTPPPAEMPVATAAPADAAPEPDAPPDAGPSAELAAAPAWVFRYDTPDRAETWTMRHHDGQAVIDVQSARGTVRYLGTATDGATLKLDVSTTTGRVQLDCKRTSRKIGTGCRDRKPAALDVLDCYVEGFTEPMPFAPDPGVAYVATSDCTGYQRIPAGG